MKNKIIAVIYACIIAGIYSPSALADGKELYASKSCVTCHGPDGKSIAPIWPNLAGQHKQYLINQIKDIKDGKRNNGMSSSMTPMVVDITDAEIEAIADFLSKVQP